MFEETLRIVNLFELRPQIKGRKRIQKVFYLLKYLGYDVPFRYRYHFYGPYSEDLQMELTMKLCLGLWEETYEGQECVYTVKSEKIPDFKREIAKISDKATDVQPYPRPLVERLVATDVNVLELTSTLAYFIDNDIESTIAGNDEKNVEERARKEALKLKPRLKNYMSQAEELYRSLQQNRKS
jgi:uncharacterized protein YwgA